MIQQTPQAAWRTAVNPDVLLDIVQPRAVWPAQPEPLTAATARRLQMFGCACARMVWAWLPTDARSAVLVRERYADGRATVADLRASMLRAATHPTAYLHHAMSCVYFAAGHQWRSDPQPPSWDAVAAARAAAKSLACHAAGVAPPRPREQQWHDAWNAAFAEARAYQAELMRDIFPPPGPAPVLPRAWRTDTVLALARQMDATGDFSAVPILADALQDAGCEDEALLGRCRAPSGAHARGNWVVDLVLGRA